MLPLFKIRAHSAGKIAGEINRPTVKQLALLAKLEAKPKRTAKQDETLAELIAKRDAKPNLSAGAKTYCKKWLKEQEDFYNRRAEFSNKYTERGIICEPAAIELMADAMGYGEISKNEQRFEDEHFLGIPDVILRDEIPDVKASWSWETFPLFEDKLPESDYFYQGQVYAELTGKSRFSVNYCLLNTPEEIIMREAFYQSRKAGFDEVEMELYDEVKAKMTYDGLPVHLRFKRFAFDKDETVIAALRQQVELCRVYIAELVAKMPQQPQIIIAEQTEPGVTIISQA